MFSRVTLWYFAALTFQKNVSGVHIILVASPAMLKSVLKLCASRGSVHHWRKKISIVYSCDRKTQITFCLKNTEKAIWQRFVSHHASLFNFSNWNDLELHVNHNRGTYQEYEKDLLLRVKRNWIGSLGYTCLYLYPVYKVYITSGRSKKKKAWTLYT